MSWEIATGFIVIGVMFFFLYFANSLQGGEWFHKGLRLLLICLSVFTATIAGNLALAHAKANTASLMVVTSLESLYGTLIYSQWFIMALVVLYFIWEVIMSSRAWSRNKEDEMMGR